MAGMNIVDLLAILPFYIELIEPPSEKLVPPSDLPMTATSDFPIPAALPPTSPLEVEMEVEHRQGMDDVLQVFRIFKLARILKLAR